MKFMNFSAERMQLELTSADISASLNEVNINSIRLYQLEQKDPFTICFWVNHIDLALLELIASKRGDKIRILSDKRLNKTIYKILHRPILFAGGCVILFLLFYMPTTILFIQVEGNSELSTEEIITAGENCGISFGASRKEVRSEKVKNMMLDILPQLQWVGVNTKGCVAILSVTEKTQPQKNEIGYTGCLVAARDGIITSYELEEGNLLCTVGQAVREGQLLISGFRDCGLTIRVEQATGEIFAQTKRNIDIIIPTDCYSKCFEKVSKRKITLMIGKKRINLWKGSGISDTIYDRMYEEYYIKLPGGYELPFGIAIDSYIVYQLDSPTIDFNALEKSVIGYGQEYLLQQMIAGNIENHSETFDIANDKICMTGEYVCTEMICKTQLE